MTHCSTGSPITAISLRLETKAGASKTAPDSHRLAQRGPTGNPLRIAPSDSRRSLHDARVPLWTRGRPSAGVNIGRRSRVKVQCRLTPITRSGSLGCKNHQSFNSLRESRGSAKHPKIPVPPEGVNLEYPSRLISMAYKGPRASFVDRGSRRKPRGKPREMAKKRPRKGRKPTDKGSRDLNWNNHLTW